MKQLAFSALDLVPVLAGQTPRDAIDRAAATARAAEKLGLVRYLVAEHHNTPRLASSATAVVVQHVLANTEKIQVGAGGVMLPNHSPLQVAETYATLDQLYPGRVDLGIGRAPGTDPMTASLITRKHYLSNQDFYDDIMVLMSYFADNPPAGVRAYPGAGAKVHPIILGSTAHSAYVAAACGLPYAFATHFSKDAVYEAVKLYREKFRPSPYLQEPYVIISLWNFAAETTEEAEHEYELQLRYMMEMLSGKNAAAEAGEEPPELTSGEKILLSARSGAILKGAPADLPAQWQHWQDTVDPDELMLAAFRSDPSKIATSLEIVKQALGSWPE